MYKLNTIDLDKASKHDLARVVMKIVTCPSQVKMRVIEIVNTQKGYHIKFWCLMECDVCRFVFDDQKRFAMDFKKPVSRTNVLFSPFSAHKHKVDKIE